MLLLCVTLSVCSLSSMRAVCFLCQDFAMVADALYSLLYYAVHGEIAAPPPPPPPAAPVSAASPGSSSTPAKPASLFGSGTAVAAPISTGADGDDGGDDDDGEPTTAADNTEDMVAGKDVDALYHDSEASTHRLPKALQPADVMNVTMRPYQLQVCHRQRGGLSQRGHCTCTPVC